MAPWFMDQKFVYTFRWESHFDVRLETYTMLPVWIELPFRSIILEKCRKQVAGALGKVLYYVQGDELSSFPHDRACILWDTTRPVPKSVKIQLTDDLAIWQPVNFRNIPYHYFKCSRRGHIARDCGKESAPSAPIIAPHPLSPGGIATDPLEVPADESLPRAAPGNDDTHMHAVYEDEQEEEVDTEEHDQLAAGSHDVDAHDPESTGPETKLVDVVIAEAAELENVVIVEAAETAVTPAGRREDHPGTPLHAATQTPLAPLIPPGISPMVTDSEGDRSEYEEHFSQNMIKGDKARKQATRTPEVVGKTIDKTGKKQKKQLQFSLPEGALRDGDPHRTDAAPALLASGGLKKGTPPLKPIPSDTGTGHTRRVEPHKGKDGHSNPSPGS
ncbi:unnamed protein product [Calypogeia fissa]